MNTSISEYHERENKLRQLAIDLAKDIRPANDILKDLDINDEEYEEIKNTRAFQSMYNAALAEWNAAGNTQKRAKLKAAAMTEEVLPFFYDDITERKESLTARVALLNTLAKIGGLGQPEPVGNAGSGQFFKLEIHLQGRNDPIIIDGQAEELHNSKSDISDLPESLPQSQLATAEDKDEF